MSFTSPDPTVSAASVRNVAQSMYRSRSPLPPVKSNISFRFDTGCDVTTVSEDVAAALGLPAGGTRDQRVRGDREPVAGRLVTVRFRFPPDAISGYRKDTLSSTWIVIAGRTERRPPQLSGSSRRTSASEPTMPTCTFTNR